MPSGGAITGAARWWPAEFRRETERQQRDRREISRNLQV